MRGQEVRHLPGGSFDLIHRCFNVLVVGGNISIKYTL